MRLLVGITLPAPPSSGTATVTTTRHRTSVRGAGRCLSERGRSDTARILTADLSVTKVPERRDAQRRDVVTWTITVSNAGPDAATNVDVQDILPNGYTTRRLHRGRTSPVDAAAADSHWTIASLASGGSAVLTYQAQVQARAQG